MTLRTSAANLWMLESKTLPQAYGLIWHGVSRASALGPIHGVSTGWPRLLIPYGTV